jgi:hypothetical protein
LQDELTQRSPRAAGFYSCRARRALQHDSDILIGYLFEMTQGDDFPVLARKLLKNHVERIAKLSFIVLIIGGGQSTQRRQFRVNAGLLYLKLGKRQHLSTAKASSFVAASIYGNAAEPRIKRSIDIKGFEREIHLAQYYLKNIIRVSRRTSVPANEAQKLVLVFADQIFECRLVAVLASAYQCAILQT